MLLSYLIAHSLLLAYRSMACAARQLTIPQIIASCAQDLQSTKVPISPFGNQLLAMDVAMCSEPDRFLHFMVLHYPVTKSLYLL